MIIKSGTPTLTPTLYAVPKQMRVSGLGGLGAATPAPSPVASFFDFSNINMTQIILIAVVGYMAYRFMIAPKVKDYSDRVAKKANIKAKIAALQAELRSA